MISRDKFIQAASQQARFEILPDDGSFYGEILSCQGVYANAHSMEACRNELREVLEEWVSLRLRMNLRLPDF